jgi:TRAP-type C4-dicarboxylate transport system permease small subunit
MLDLIDRVGGFCGKLAAGAFVAVGAMITYEVVMRYLFVAPTIWAEELSRFVQIWATYLAAALVLKKRELIAITILVERVGPAARRALEAFALVWIIAFSVVAVVYGLDILIDSIRLGRATSTMLAVPKWLTESAIPVGFGLLALQALGALVRLFNAPPTVSDADADGSA